jgi:hypothetical protein
LLFEKRLRDGLVDGSVSLAFRRWRRAQVIAGGQYRLGAGAGVVRVSSVDVVSTDQITAEDARAAGFASPAEVIADLGSGPADEGLTFRIAFGAVSEDPRDVLSERSDDLAVLAPRVRRIAHADETLAAIDAQPGVRAADLMGPLGWNDLHAFKMHVRRLKALGLTISLPVGYRLSPRGEAYVRQTKRPRP